MKPGAPSDAGVNGVGEPPRTLVCEPIGVVHSPFSERARAPRQPAAAQHVSGRILLDRIDILIDGVGGAAVPMLVDPLLRRDDVDVFAEVPAEKAPADVDVPVEAGRLVLSKQENLS